MHPLAFMPHSDCRRCSLPANGRRAGSVARVGTNSSVPSSDCPRGGRAVQRIGSDDDGAQAGPNVGALNDPTGGPRPADLRADDRALRMCGSGRRRDVACRGQAGTGRGFHRAETQRVRRLSPSGGRKPSRPLRAAVTKLPVRPAIAMRTARRTIGTSARVGGFGESATRSDRPDSSERAFGPGRTERPDSTERFDDPYPTDESSGSASNENGPYPLPFELQATGRGAIGSTMPTPSVRRRYPGALGALKARK